jgi:hypothetical protein
LRLCRDRVQTGIMLARMRTAVAIFLLPALCPGARLTSAAQHAFADYVAAYEARLTKLHARPETYLPSLNLDSRLQAALEDELIAGAVRIEPMDGVPCRLSGALLHHWRGVAFAPDAMPRTMLSLLRDYNHLSSYYAPQVASARVFVQKDNSAMVFMRLKEREVITVVLDAEYAVESGSVGDCCGYSFSRSEHIWQVDNPWTAQERRRPEGEDDGFLWRLNSYWSFRRLRNGLLIECDAISLTRDVPPGLGWMITPIIRNLPRSSLEFTLNATRRALSSRASQEVR